MEIADVVKEIVRFMRLDKTLTAKSVIEVGITPVVVFADRAKLKTVLLNLIRNALEAVQGKTEGRVTVSNRIEKSDVFVSVEDNGKGISEENLKG
ncbi:MAG: hypothetical protein FJ088_07795, partial [Deltaproteobacteria bacterium]|nr:hypothetical protein [Deltaproteobacteria bacterium]